MDFKKELKKAFKMHTSLSNRLMVGGIRTKTKNRLRTLKYSMIEG